jgi:uncharacterized protein YebE (UPF0316 family)
MEIFENQFFLVYLLPVVIFFARILDVTIGTIRIIMLSKGMKYLAPILGFFEVLVWIIVISNVMKYANGFIPYIAYSLGFAAGNFIGMILEEKVAIGFVVLRVITSKRADKLINSLNENGIGATYIDAFGGNNEPVNIIFSIVKRNNLDYVLSIVQTFNPNAFYTIEDVRNVNKGIFPATDSRKLAIFSNWKRRGK